MEKGLYSLIVSLFCSFVLFFFFFFFLSIFGGYMRLGNAQGFANLIVVFFSLVTYATTEAATSITWLTPRGQEGDTPLVSPG